MSRQLQHVVSSMFVLIPQQDAASYKELAVANPVSQSHTRKHSVSDLLTSLVFQICSGGRDVVAASATAGARRPGATLAAALPAAHLHR